jgi:hypothetical protein
VLKQKVQRRFGRKKEKMGEGRGALEDFFREKGKRPDSFAGGAFARTKNLEKRSEWSTALQKSLIGHP